MKIDEGSKQWLEKNGKASSEGIAQSSIFLGLMGGGHYDPLQVLQIGYAVLMDKPILLIVDKDWPVAKHIVKVADEIHRVDFKDKEKFKAETGEIVKKFAEKFGK